MGLSCNNQLAFPCSWQGHTAYITGAKRSQSWSVRTQEESSVVLRASDYYTFIILILLRIINYALIEPWKRCGACQLDLGTSS